MSSKSLCEWISSISVSYNCSTPFWLLHLLLWQNHFWVLPRAAPDWPRSRNSGWCQQCIHHHGNLLHGKLRLVRICEFHFWLGCSDGRILDSKDQGYNLKKFSIVSAASRQVCSKPMSRQGWWCKQQNDGIVGKQACLKYLERFGQLSLRIAVNVLLLRVNLFLN